MCRRFRTLEQCKAQYKTVTVDGSVWRVRRRGLFGWSFVLTEQVETTTFGIFFADKPASFPTQQEALAAIDKWAQADYTAQPAAWQ